MNQAYLVMIFNENTIVTESNASKVIAAANEWIAQSKQTYGFISKRWKPLIVSDPWIYEKRAEANRILRSSK
jgi:hypothetical protein